MKQEMPELNPKPEKQELPLDPEVRRLGYMGSSINKFLSKDTRIPKGKEWARDLIREVPVSQLPTVSDFLETTPPDQVEEVAEQLTRIIKGLAHGILRSPDPEAELKRCIEEARKRIH